jgi:Metal binding domain of Ada
LDLVKPSSKLPWWMRPRIEVQIKTLTREAQAQLTTQPVGITPKPAVPAPPVIPVQPPYKQTPGEVAQKTLRNALNYAFINIWWGWIWFPFLRSIFHAFGATFEAAGFLSISTFLILCTLLGHKRTVDLGARSPVTQTSMKPAFPSSPPTIFVATPRPVMVSPPLHRLAVGGKGFSQPTTSFVGNSVTMVFHRTGCEWAKRISARNRRAFSSSSQARSGGYRPCRVCNP